MEKLVKSIPVLMLMVGCNTGSPQAETDYEKMMSQHDSLIKVEQVFKDSLRELRADHQELERWLTDGDSLDDEHIRNMAEHEVIFEKMEVTMASHEMLIAAHDSLRRQHDEGKMTDKEIKAQTGKMIKQHERMMSDHKKIRTNFQTIKDEHQKAREALMPKGK